MDLFEHAGSQTPDLSPLAEKLRPKDLDDVLGQAKILGEHTPWMRLLKAGHLPSLILWGPPGCGKTTFALLIAQKVDAEVISENAIDLGAKTLRELGEAARRRRLERRRKTVLFIDEIHRLNRSQQDVLLPFLEKGDVVLIGATTENPSYELNSALLSRCRILVFEKLEEADLQRMLDKACRSAGVTCGDLLSGEAIAELLRLADGDGRRLLNMIEIILNLYQGEAPAPVEAPLAALAETQTQVEVQTDTETEALASSGGWPLQVPDLEDLLSGPVLRYDKTADEHYNTVSAFIKSIRGSDPDAAVYYLARMIKGGEDPVFIARRLVILASEDVGNADPRALSLAVSGLQAVELVGWPEAAISLAQVTTYLASAPKSNRSYLALRKAQEIVERTGTLSIPLALRSSQTSSMKALGYGKDYKYSHEGPKGYVRQEFLPEEIRGEHLYEPSDRGFEKSIRQYLEWMKS